MGTWTWLYEQNRDNPIPIMQIQRRCKPQIDASSLFRGSRFPVYEAVPFGAQKLILVLQRLTRANRRLQLELVTWVGTWRISRFGARSQKAYQERAATEGHCALTFITGPLPSHQLSLPLMCAFRRRVSNQEPSLGINWDCRIYAQGTRLRRKIQGHLCGISWACERHAMGQTPGLP